MIIMCKIRRLLLSAAICTLFALIADGDSTTSRHTPAPATRVTPSGITNDVPLKLGQTPVPTSSSNDGNGLSTLQPGPGNMTPANIVSAVQGTPPTSISRGMTPANSASPERLGVTPSPSNVRLSGTPPGSAVGLNGSNTAATHVRRPITPAGGGNAAELNSSIATSGGPVRIPNTPSQASVTTAVRLGNTPPKSGENLQDNSTAATVSGVSGQSNSSTVAGVNSSTNSLPPTPTSSGGSSSQSVSPQSSVSPLSTFPPTPTSSQATSTARQTPTTTVISSVATFTTNSRRTTPTQSSPSVSATTTMSSASTPSSSTPLAAVPTTLHFPASTPTLSSSISSTPAYTSTTPTFTSTTPTFPTPIFSPSTPYFPTSTPLISFSSSTPIYPTSTPTFIPVSHILTASMSPVTKTTKTAGSSSSFLSSTGTATSTNTESTTTNTVSTSASTSSSSTPSTITSTMSSTPSSTVSTQSTSPATSSSSTTSSTPNSSSSSGPTSAAATTSATVTTVSSSSSGPTSAAATTSATVTTVSSTLLVAPTTTTLSPNTPPAPSTPQTTIVLTATPTMSGTATMSPLGPVIHVQIIFCNAYQSYVPTDPASVANYLNRIQLAILNATGVSLGRIQSVTLVPDPTTGRIVLQFDVYPGPGMSSSDLVLYIINQVSTKAFYLTVLYFNDINVNCNQPMYPIYNWTDLGPCPNQPCTNMGICGCRPTGKYYCQCPPMYTGQFCEIYSPPESPSGRAYYQSNQSLLALVVIPAFIALMLLLLCFFCICRQCCCVGVGANQHLVDIIEEEDVYSGINAGSVRSSRRSMPPIYAIKDPVPHVSYAMAYPGGTYYHAMGRPFGVAFNDSTFNSTPSNGFYSTMGQKITPSVYGDGEIQEVLFGASGGNNLGGASVLGAGSGYGESTSNSYETMVGQKVAIAFNDRTFNTYSSTPRNERLRHYN